MKEQQSHKTEQPGYMKEQPGCMKGRPGRRTVQTGYKKTRMTGWVGQTPLPKPRPRRQTKKIG